MLTVGFIIFKKIRKDIAPQINFSGLLLKDIKGSEVNLQDFSGKPIVVNFWGSWCGPCRQELPGFEKAFNKYGSLVNFLLISDEPLEQIIKFKEENSYTISYYQSKIPFNELGITAVPVTCFYDKKGKLITAKKDTLNEKELYGHIEKIIGD